MVSMITSVMKLWIMFLTAQVWCTMALIKCISHVVTCGTAIILQLYGKNSNTAPEALTNGTSERQSIHRNIDYRRNYLEYNRRGSRRASPGYIDSDDEMNPPSRNYSREDQRGYRKFGTEVVTKH